MTGAAVTEGLWQLAPSHLSISTTIVGNPIFSDYAYQRYQWAFYLIALGFPLFSFVFYHLLARWGPLRRRTPPAGSWWPVVTDLSVRSSAEAVATSPLPSPTEVTETASADDDPGPGSAVGSVVSSAARVALPAMAVGLEVTAGLGPRQMAVAPATYLGAAAYVVVVAVAAVLLSRLRPLPVSDRADRFRWQSPLRAANAPAALIVMPLLYLVSRATNVYVASAGRSVQYAWLPLWLAVAGTLVCAAVLIRWWKDCGVRPTARRTVESRVLVWIVGPVWFFLLLAALPSALGSFQAFDDAQFLAGPQLIFHHGLFPWRDLYLLHGLLQDVLTGGFGMAVFGNTRWGSNAGFSMFVGPLMWLSVYYLAAHFCRKNRLTLVVIVASVTVGFVAANAYRFLLIPIFLLVLEYVIRGDSWRRCVVFTFTLFAGALLSPEAALFVICAYIVLAVFEWTGYRRGSGARVAFRRTGRCIALGVAMVLAWFAYLMAEHSLPQFITYYTAFSTNHALWGAYGAGWNFSQQAGYTFEFWIPVVLWLGAVWWAIAKLRARKVWISRDWVLLAAASFTVVYYPKVLARADWGHVVEVFTVAVPLFALLLIEVLAWLDRLVAEAWRRLTSALRREWRLRRVTITCLASLLSVVAIILGSNVFPSSALAIVKQLPGRTHAYAPVPAPADPARLGYTFPGTVNTSQILTLGRILDYYAGPKAPVIDYANELGVTYYLLDRVPGTRFYPIAVSETENAQQQTVADFRKSRPPVTIFYDTTFGLPEYDGIPEAVRTYDVSRYLLSHYRPVLDYDGQLIMLRNDLTTRRRPLPSLPPGSFTTSNLYFATPVCTFGDIPNFFTLPRNYATSARVNVTLRQVSAPSMIVGWALGDNRKPARSLIAAQGSKIVAKVSTGILRTDVAAALKNQAAATSGFQIAVPAGTGPVNLWAIGTDGSATPIGGSPKMARSVAYPASVGPTVSLGGHTYRVTSAGQGNVDSVHAPTGRSFEATFPKGTDLADYQWAQVSVPRSLGSSTIELTNNLAAGTNNAIRFHSLARSGPSESVMVGSCLQWRGYQASQGINLVVRGHAAHAGPIRLTLVR
ncbi:MAG: hypothetical protein ACYCU7_02325 [Acidimicrobiales bacterium]